MASITIYKSRPKRLTKKNRKITLYDTSEQMIIKSMISYRPSEDGILLEKLRLRDYDCEFTKPPKVLDEPEIEIGVECVACGTTPAPTEAPTPSPTPQPTPSPTPQPTPSPTPQPSPSPTPQPSPSPTPQPSPSPTPQPSPAPTPQPSPTPTPTGGDGECGSLFFMAEVPPGGVQDPCDMCCGEMLPQCCENLQSGGCEILTRFSGAFWDCTGQLECPLPNGQMPTECPHSGPCEWDFSITLYNSHPNANFGFGCDWDNPRLMNSQGELIYDSFICVEDAENEPSHKSIHFKVGGGCRCGRNNNHQECSDPEGCCETYCSCGAGGGDGEVSQCTYENRYSGCSLVIQGESYMVEGCLFAPDFCCRGPATEFYLDTCGVEIPCVFEETSVGNPASKCCSCEDCVGGNWIPPQGCEPSCYGCVGGIEGWNDGVVQTDGPSCPGPWSECP